eukprot:PhF_6_TR38164/c0_g1_i1/m.57015
MAILCKCGLVVLLVVLLFASTIEAKHSLKLRKYPNVFSKSNPSTRASGIATHKQVGNVIPMNGGYLTVGAYFAEITVGTGKGQVTFDALVDTGSSNTAVPSNTCPTCGTPSNDTYTPWKSPTHVPLYCEEPMCKNCKAIRVGSSQIPPDGQNVSSCEYAPRMCQDNICGFGISYGGSSTFINGVIGQDTMCFSTSSAPVLCAKSYIYQITAQYPTANLVTGIIGLAFPANACNPTCQPTWMDSMVSQGVLAPENDLYGMCLRPSSGGVLDVGFIDNSKFDGALFYSPVVKKHWYNLNVLDVRINGVTIGLPAYVFNIRNDAIGSFVDSGTSTLLFSPLGFQTISNIFLTNYSSLPHVQDLFSGSNCANISDPSILNQYPSVDIVISGEGEGSFYTLSAFGVNYVMQTGGSTYCLGMAGVPSLGIVMGDVIMQNYYIVFDRYNARVGFAPVKSC